MTGVAVGFTGTREGLTAAQADTLAAIFDRLVDEHVITEFHHGDCVGADDYAHHLAAYHLIPVIIHPPVKSSLRAYCMGAYRIRTQRPYLERNREIVQETGLMIATPNTYTHDARSGTWTTVAYARDMDKPLFLIYPDGNVTFEMSVDPEELDMAA